MCYMEMAPLVVQYKSDSLFDPNSHTTLMAEQVSCLSCLPVMAMGPELCDCNACCTPS